MISLLVKIFKYFFTTVIALVGLTILLMSSVWVAGPRIFVLENYKNILFTYSKIDSPRSQIYLAYFFPNTKEITIIPIESDQVSVLGGYGDYELGRVYPLLDLEKKNTSFKLAALSWSTQTFVDNIVNIKLNTKIDSKKELQQQLWVAAFSNLANPKEFIELSKAFFFAKSIPVEQITFEDSSAVSDLDTLDSVVLYEGCSVAVVNTTEVVGLASKMSVVLEKNGAVVVRVMDQNSPYQLSTLSFSPTHGSCQLLSERLRMLFPGKITQRDDEQFQREYRADLVIFIGKDLADLI